MYNSIATMCGWYVGGVLITVKYDNFDAIMWSRTNLFFILIYFGICVQEIECRW